MVNYELNYEAQMLDSEALWASTVRRLRHYSTNVTQNAVARY